MKKYECIKRYPGNDLGDTKIIQDLGCHLDKIKSTKETFFEYWREIEELCVPVGTKFKHITGDTIYTIESIVDDTIVVSWHELTYKDSLKYFISAANKFFKSGDWIKCDEIGYQIIAFARDGFKDPEWVLEGDRYFSVIGSWSLKDLLYDGACVASSELYIHTVKRLSDGQTFTIGDKVQYSVRDEWYEDSISNITKFKIHNENILIGTNTDEDWANLSDQVRKVKPLFTTCDGVDIYDRNKTCVGVFINLRDYPIEQHYLIRENSFDYFKSYGLKYWKIFFNKEKAEQYIKENKPMFSFMDVLTLYDDSKSSFIDKLKYTIDERFEKDAKQRINTEDGKQSYTII